MQLRSDIEIVRTSPKSFVVLDPQTGGSFVCTPADRQLLALMDGVRGPAELRRDFADRYGREISERHIHEFLEQLRMFGLLREAVEPGSGDDAPAKTAPTMPTKKVVPPNRVARMNRRFDVLAALFGWVFHPFWMLPCSAVILVGIAVLAHNFDRYGRELSTLFLGIPTLVLIPLSLLQTVLVMNLPRELVIATAFRRYGVWLRHFGLAWVNDTLPFFSCDRGEAARPLSRRGRWTILLSGWWCQMTLGALYTIGWAMAPRASGIGVFCLLMILPWLLAMVLHFNVLARLDGYKVLSFVLDEPLLMERAVAHTRAWLRGRTPPEALTDRQRFWFRVYGVGWYGWIWFLRLLYVVGGMYWLIVRMGGLGALLGVGAVLVWYRKRIGSFLMDKTGTEWMFRSGGKAWVRWLVRGLIVTGIVAIGFIPYDESVSGECRIVALDEAGVRVQVADEIVKIHVSDGQWVKAGDVIATLSGRDVLRDLEQREAEVREAQAQYDLLLAGSRPEEIAIAEQELELWRIRLEFSESELTRLKKLEDAGAADPDEMREAVKERDSALQLHLSAQEKLSRVKQGSREEEKAAGKARLEATQARLAQVQAKKGLLTVTAPIAGKVITPAVKLREGLAAQVGDLIATIQDTSRIRVEIAADEAAALTKVGMVVEVRLSGLDGRLLTGKLESLAPAALPDNQFRIERYRSDREALIEEGRDRETDAYHIRVYAELDPTDVQLMPGMTGQARITIGPDRLWRAVVRPVVRYFRTEVWSWLP